MYLTLAAADCEALEGAELFCHSRFLNAGGRSDPLPSFLMSLFDIFHIRKKEKPHMNAIISSIGGKIRYQMFPSCRKIHGTMKVSNLVQ